MTGMLCIPFPGAQPIHRDSVVLLGCIASHPQELSPFTETPLHYQDALYPFTKLHTIWVLLNNMCMLYPVRSRAKVQ